MTKNTFSSRSSRQRGSMPSKFSALALALFAASSLPVATAQNCISLAGSSECSAFNASSISTTGEVAGIFPFLAFVSDRQTFDEQLRQYIATSYPRHKYQQLIGCSSVNLSNTTALYARYTTSVICNAIVQNSIGTCSLSADQSAPLCADACAEQAISEQQITASPELCGTPGTGALSQIRADFTNCALPGGALDNKLCVSGWENEPNNCGYQDNLGGLCAYCATSTVNSTDSCCINAQAESRCVNVRLPFTTSVAPLFPSSTAPGSQPTNGTAPVASDSDGLSGGAIAGIVVASIAGAVIILLLIAGILILRRRRAATSHSNSSLNQPTPSRHGPPAPAMSFTGSSGVGAEAPNILPGARVARLAALESSSSSSNHGHVAAYNRPSSDAYDSPDSHRHYGAGIPPKRTGSLSSHDHESPDSRIGPRGQTPGGTNGNGDYSSPEGLGSGQSEQLQSFKDYYSQEEIKPGDAVATLWAYAPRANDEFELERGDMLKVVGIWDDGWATGVQVRERAEEWEERRRENRDSGVSNGSGLPVQGARVGDDDVGPTEGEIKAFPLVCVCLPQHWRKTIESDTADPGMGGPPGGHPPASP
ncbi:hypothetical protein P152DRAFT_5062 [Eremomyces bilateralis CBS 781.70]|uniref:SH3 domain-containing protein n=1 Tax=Eremomyces bilateralis CBS 781.70 TaxID=1392243 RepID=A0A6G1GG44_9PEZI|nr:uncharacterized protein P152DRAFT_5062 [Eremomyces bilateralis CBS 781.70]KAF1816962.1 hypothetical protein P152DRAFT_5062 [Eremomyces bilateralis CBS 781.70]